MIRISAPFLVAVWILSAWSVACESGTSEPGSVVRDSAGVVIVESRTPAWNEGAGWTVGEEALVRIGEVEGDEAYLLSNLVGAVRFQDGTIAAGDFGSQELRIFDAAGVHLRTVGGEGGGPGEFTGLSGLGRGPGDRAWAYDFSLRRLTWMDSSGELGDQVHLGPEPPVLNPVGPLLDGSFVLRQLWGASAVSEANELGLRRDPVAFVRFDGQGQLVDTLGMFPGRELVITEEDGRGVMGSAPLGRTTSAAIWGNRLVAGAQTSYELGEYTAEGGLVRILRHPDYDLTTSPEAIEAYVLGQLEGVPPEERARARAEIENRTMPPTRPAYGMLLADTDGNLWVGDHAPFPRVPASWSVFDSEGRWLGEVRMPTRFVPMDIGGDWILGTEKDELDVEYLVVYSLFKPEK